MLSLVYNAKKLFGETSGSFKVGKSSLASLLQSILFLRLFGYFEMNGHNSLCVRSPGGRPRIPRGRTCSQARSELKI